MEIGKMKYSDVHSYLVVIAHTYGLRLNRVKEFKMARLILANLYNMGI